MARAQGREYRTVITIMYKSFVIGNNFTMDKLLAALSVDDQ